MTATGWFAEEVAERGRNMPWDEDLRDIAESCLSLDPKLRPRIADVLAKLTNSGADS